MMALYEPGRIVIGTGSYGITISIDPYSAWRTNQPCNPFCWCGLIGFRNLPKWFGGIGPGSYRNEKFILDRNRDGPCALPFYSPGAGSFYFFTADFFPVCKKKYTVRFRPGRCQDSDSNFYFAGSPHHTTGFIYTINIHFCYQTKANHYLAGKQAADGFGLIYFRRVLTVITDISPGLSHHIPVNIMRITGTDGC